MRLLLNFVFFYAIVIELGNANYGVLLENLNRTDKYLHKLRLLLTDIAFVGRIERCLVIITDDVHHPLYERRFFEESSRPSSSFILNIDDTEDLFAPNYKTVKVLKEIQNSQCDLYLITVLNGLQVKRFLKFIDRHRVLNMQQNFVFLHDDRLFERDMIYIWSSIISSVFLHPTEDYERYSLSSIAYPVILAGEFVITKKIVTWQPGKRLNAALLFPEKTSNLKGVKFPIAVYPHIPMIKRQGSGPNYTGLEIEIIRALSIAMNFQPHFYETADSVTERWGRDLPNGTFTGLLGQLTNRSARIAIGDLRLYKLYYSAVDFSWPHSLECLTFLTPESSQDDTWKTLISPFRGAMWAGVLLSLFAVGTIFYTMSYIHAILLRSHNSTASFEGFCMFFRRRAPKVEFDSRIFRNVRFRSYLNRMRTRPRQLDLFDTYANCLLYTYSMLMYVSLPRMPINWPLRVLTGWYWLYCILLTATYRASFTAILANPAARITIDTLDQLSKSHISTSTWGKENKELFENAFDKVLQDISRNLEITDDIESVTDRIAEGRHAYYDNIYFLRYLRSNRSGSGSDEILHIMHDCVVQMPVALGLEKNSPLKPYIDKYLIRMRESGLITKWLKDAIKDLKAAEQSPQEALMDLRKFWSSFVALVFGYIIGIFAIIAERLHFMHIVQKHPLYDEYNPKLYYNFKRRFPNAVY